MGITNVFRSSKREKQFMNFTSENWQLQQQTTRRDDFGEFNTYRHKITHEEIDKYTLFFHSELEEMNYYECLLERLREDYIVNTVYYENKNYKEFCSTAHQGDVYIQHIPVRLCDITDIPFEEFLYMLKLSLLGFQKLYQSVGYFQVKEDLICIDKEGTVRVWMNSDLSKNYPEGYEKDGEGSRDSQRLMVGQIITMIQKNTEDSEGLHANIGLYFQQNGIKYPTFHEAIDLLNNYVKEYKIRLPSYCESVIQIFRDDYGAQFNIFDEDDELFMGETGSSHPSRQNILDHNLLNDNGRFSNNGQNYSNNQTRQNGGYSNRPSNNEEVMNIHQDEASESRGFLLSDIKENSNENALHSATINHGEPQRQFYQEYYQTQSTISPPRVTFSYNGVNSNQFLTSSEKKLYAPLHYYRISQRQESSDYRESLREVEREEMQMEVDPQIYNDMLKYL